MKKRLSTMSGVSENSMVSGISAGVTGFIEERAYTSMGIIGKHGWLSFLGIGRLTDEVALAANITADSRRLEQMTRGAFCRLLPIIGSKLQPGQRCCLCWEVGNVYFLVDHQGLLVYCLITSTPQYPARLAYQLLHDLSGEVSLMDQRTVEELPENGLLKDLSPKMTELLEDFQNPEKYALLQGMHELEWEEVEVDDEDADEYDEDGNRVAAKKIIRRRILKEVSEKPPEDTFGIDCNCIGFLCAVILAFVIIIVFILWQLSSARDDGAAVVVADALTVPDLRETMLDSLQERTAFLKKVTEM